MKYKDLEDKDISQGYYIDHNPSGRKMAYCYVVLGEDLRIVYNDKVEIINPEDSVKRAQWLRRIINVEIAKAFLKNSLNTLNTPEKTLEEKEINADKDDNQTTIPRR